MEKELNELINRYLKTNASKIKKEVLCQFYTLLIDERVEDIEKAFKIYFPEYYNTPIPIELSDN